MLIHPVQVIAIRIVPNSASADYSQQNDNEEMGDRIEDIADPHHQFLGALPKERRCSAPEDADPHVDQGR